MLIHPLHALHTFMTASFKLFSRKNLGKLGEERMHGEDVLIVCYRRNNIIFRPMIVLQTVREFLGVAEAR